MFLCWWECSSRRKNWWCRKGRKLLERCPWVSKKGRNLEISKRLALEESAGSSSTLTVKKAEYMDRALVGSKCSVENLLKVFSNRLYFFSDTRSKIISCELRLEKTAGGFSRNETVWHSYQRECEKWHLSDGDGPVVSEIVYSELTPRWKPLALPFSTLPVDFLP